MSQCAVTNFLIKYKQKKPYLGFSLSLLTNNTHISDYRQILSCLIPCLAKKFRNLLAPVTSLLFAQFDSDFRSRNIKSDLIISVFLAVFLTKFRMSNRWEWCRNPLGSQLYLKMRLWSWWLGNLVNMIQRALGDFINKYNKIKYISNSISHF